VKSRPFISLGISDLEKKFDENRDNQAFVNKLLHELSHRRTNRAKTLQRRALQAKGFIERPKTAKPSPKKSDCPSFQKA